MGNGQWAMGNGQWAWPGGENWEDLEPEERDGESSCKGLYVRARG